MIVYNNYMIGCHTSALEHAEELYNQLLIISIVDINMIKVIKVGNTH